MVKVIKESVQKAGIRMEDLDCIAFTKGAIFSMPDTGEGLMVRTGNGYTTSSRGIGGPNFVSVIQHTSSRCEPLRWT